MNELRMYVEHLFEGKVLTPENIELKEEIYGNLVARYEDLLSEGVPEADALRRTKESITSVDDVLAGRDAEAMAGNAGNGAEGLGTSASEAESVKASCEAFVPREPGAEDGSTCASGSSECGHHQDAAEVVRPLDADERVVGSVQDAADTGKGGSCRPNPGCSRATHLEWGRCSGCWRRGENAQAVAMGLRWCRGVRHRIGNYRGAHVWRYGPGRHVGRPGRLD